MYRATTPKQIFTFEKNPTEFEKILITYVQNGSIVLEKTEEDLHFEEGKICPCDGNLEYDVWFRMTQEESNMFAASQKKPVSVQVRILTEFGDALASDIKTFSVQEVLNDDVLAVQGNDVEQNNQGESEGGGEP